MISYYSYLWLLYSIFSSSIRYSLKSFLSWSYSEGFWNVINWNLKFYFSKISYIVFYHEKSWSFHWISLIERYEIMIIVYILKVLDDLREKYWIDLCRFRIFRDLAIIDSFLQDLLISSTHFDTWLSNHIWFLRGNWVNDALRWTRSSSIYENVAIYF